MTLTFSFISGRRFYIRYEILTRRLRQCILVKFAPNISTELFLFEGNGLLFDFVVVGYRDGFFLADFESGVLIGEPFVEGRIVCLLFEKRVSLSRQLGI